MMAPDPDHYNYYLEDKVDDLDDDLDDDSSDYYCSFLL